MASLLGRWCCIRSDGQTSERDERRTLLPSEAPATPTSPTRSPAAPSQTLAGNISSCTASPVTPQVALHQFRNEHHHRIRAQQERLSALARQVGGQMLHIPRPSFLPRRRQITPPVTPSALGLTETAVLRTAEEAGDIEIGAQTTHVTGIGEVVRDVAVRRQHATSPLLQITPRRISSAPDVAAIKSKPSPRSLSGQSTPQTPGTPAPMPEDDVRRASIGLSTLAGLHTPGSRGRRKHHHAHRAFVQVLGSSGMNGNQADVS